MNFEIKPLSAGLYFVATPIGAARDITLRGLDILASADVLAAEDTRTARKLMEIHGVPLGERRIVAFHDHSGKAVIQKLLEHMKAGRSVAYVSEAGTPLVADPGYELGVAAAGAGFAVIAAPGASAVLAALTVSGLATDRFAFVGFLPASKAARQTEIAQLRDTPFTLVFFESPKRVHELLADLCEILGGTREAAVCRELTKKFEETQRGSLAELVAAFDGRSVKGEIVVLVGRAGATVISDADVDTALRTALETMRVKDAATTVAGAFGMPRKDVYQRALGLKDET
ncbi:16S rRNA (cytidine1402-2'-O)-methyltransferase [Cognatiyoonia koreensis]|uniref:Ribosomal RNA small subunit methyltransferase I n=1 Tax=Cognatiyoonia koreensis TaxID=364200 RepID=A0A1I0QKT5_9RHOB|nr:16S rRNA (cytidine(1402)-2'-O)-methyltransferase [Cognatiyoonia koreensis]SEW27841.1 16S rRNA (cytidine1402-2'-O)-methyltransferase [Cognatiyoonia koreensis]